MPRRDKFCLRCKGFCPSGTLPNKLCLDCEATSSPEAKAREDFARALATLSPYWRAVVQYESWQSTRAAFARG